jgi:hypothetical protein
MRERPVSAVPVVVLVTLGGALVAQIALRAMAPAPPISADILSRPPSTAVLRLASFGEPIALAKILMLHLQAVDYRPGNPVPYRDLDYARVEAWLDRILELDPAGQYPLLAASRLYAEVPDPVKQRRMLEFVHREFLADPERRWPWLAHATILAKHRLHDLPLALRYAETLERHVRTEAVPPWARQMRAFILEDMNELEAARAVIGGYIESGRLADPAESRFLEQRLHDIEAKMANRRRGR